jgi:integrase
MMQLPKVAYYTGTRIGKEAQTGLLSQLWENVRFENNLVVMLVVDKGRHGGITWFKKLVGDAAVEFNAFYEACGKPESGRIFPFDYGAVVAFWREVYDEAGIPVSVWMGMPCHVWRHTAAQDMLDAADWNYGIVARTLGWETTLALEKFYGRMPDSSQLRGLLRAMGLPVKEEKTEFAF